MDASRVYNIIEIFLWPTIGLMFFIISFRKANRYKKLSWFLSIVFICFGISDYFEIYSGVWWRPWWLLAWKVLCVISFILSLGYYIIKEKRWTDHGPRASFFE